MSLFTSSVPTSWKLFERTVEGGLGNLSTCAISGLMATGTYMYTYHGLRACVQTDDRSIQDYCIHFLSLCSSAYLGGYVGRKVGFSAMPLIDPDSDDYSSLGYVAATTAAMVIGYTFLVASELFTPKKSKKT